MSDEDAVQRTVAPKQLIALIKEADQKKTRMQSLSGELGERVKAAVENGHLHKGAFGLCVKLHRMDDLKRADYIRSVRLYLDICEQEQLWGSVHTGDLATMADQADEEGADEKAAKENSKKLRKGIKPLEGGDAPGTYGPAH